MRPLAWSAIVTGTAGVLFVAVGSQASDLRVVGAAGGALLALAGVFVGASSPGPRPRLEPTTLGAPVQRFFRERRAAPREDSGRQVRVSVDGHAYDATLLNVSASGALLRVAPHIARRIHAEVGAPVRIDDEFAGAVTRVGKQGLYVDFAVAFAGAGSVAELDPAPPA